MSIWTRIEQARIDIITMRERRRAQKEASSQLRRKISGLRSREETIRSREQELDERERRLKTREDYVDTQLSEAREVFHQIETAFFLTRRAHQSALAGMDHAEDITKKMRVVR